MKLYMASFLWTCLSVCVRNIACVTLFVSLTLTLLKGHSQENNVGVLGVFHWIWTCFHTLLGLYNNSAFIYGCSTPLLCFEWQDYWFLMTVVEQILAGRMTKVRQLMTLPSKPAVMLSQRNCQRTWVGQHSTNWSDRGQRGLMEMTMMTIYRIGNITDVTKFMI